MVTGYFCFGSWMRATARSRMGKPAPELPALPTSSTLDFAQWQRSWMRGAALDHELGYWREKLAGAPPALELPTDHSRSTSHAAGHHSVSLPDYLVADILACSRREGGTPFMVVLAALAVTLQKWTGQTDMVIGTVAAGRNRRETENLIGCFMNFLPLRVNTGRHHREGPFRHRENRGPRRPEPPGLPV